MRSSEYRCGLVGIVFLSFLFLFFCSPLGTLSYTPCIPGAAPGRFSFDEYICFYPSKKEATNSIA